MRTRFLYFIVLVSLINTQIARGQTNFDAFNQLLGKGDTALIESFLTQWQIAEPDAADLYAARFNFYVWSSMQEVIVMSDKPEGENVLEIHPTDSTAQDPVQYMYGDIIYRPEPLATAMQYINAGITLFPNRLDLRFGKVYLLGETEQWDIMAEEIIKAIHYGAEHQNQWLWVGDQPVPEGNEVMFGSVQDYIGQMFDTEEDSLGEEIMMISQSILSHYPDNIENLSNLSVAYMLQNNYTEALKPLLYAETLQPRDPIVLVNIAWCYKQGGDKANAIKYYERVIAINEPDTAAFAEEMIKELSK